MAFVFGAASLLSVTVAIVPCMDAVVVGLVSGVIGVALAGLLQIRGRRLEQLRERQIAAADDFGKAAAEVFVTLTARMESLGDPAGREHEWLEEFRQAALAVRAHMHETTRRVPRLELLFGVGSATTAAAAQVTAELYQMSAQLQEGRAPLGEVTAKYNSAADAFGRFNKSAHQVVTLPSWRHWVGWTSA
jgi:hypothetical protein